MGLADVRTNLLQSWGSGGAVARNPTDAALRRSYRRRRIVGFFRPVLAPGDLVFDIGANVGEWTAALRKLDVEVVAVEPQSLCVRDLLTRHAADRLVHVVGEAVGAKAGNAELLAAEPGMEQASMAHDWMDAMVRSGRMPAGAWAGTREVVSVTTLDRLIERFGEPAYCKVDVEGFEPEVFAGLSRPLPFISFEFHAEVRQNAQSIVDRLGALGVYDFNLSVGEWLGLRYAEWLRGEDLLAEISDLDEAAWGNVFALRRG